MNMARPRLPVRRPDGRIDLVCNKSDRHGADISLIVIHTTESHNRPGRSDVDAVHAWFNNSVSEASSHVIIDAEGHSTTCVPDDEKAWTCARLNPVTLNIELVEWAVTPRWQWLKRRRQLDKCAKFVAYWSNRYGIPLRTGAVVGDRVTRSGIVGHMNLGAPGGGHHDPGPGFPFDRLIGKARYFKTNGWPN